MHRRIDDSGGGGGRRGGGGGADKKGEKDGHTHTHCIYRQPCRRETDVEYEGRGRMERGGKSWLKINEGQRSLPPKYAHKHPH